jgi:hypothetical protein
LFQLIRITGKNYGFAGAPDTGNLKNKEGKQLKPPLDYLLSLSFISCAGAFSAHFDVFTPKKEGGK